MNHVIVGKYSARKGLHFIGMKIEDKIEIVVQCATKQMRSEFLENWEKWQDNGKRGLFNIGKKSVELTTKNSNYAYEFLNKLKYYFKKNKYTHRIKWKTINPMIMMYNLTK